MVSGPTQGVADLPDGESGKEDSSSEDGEFDEHKLIHDGLLSGLNGCRCNFGCAWSQPGWPAPEWCVPRY